MARRRQPGSDWGARFARFNQMMAPLIQDLLLRERQKEEYGRDLEKIALNDYNTRSRMFDQQAIDTAQTALPEIQSGKLKLGDVSPDLMNTLGGPETVRGMSPANDTRPTIEALIKARTQADVPAIESIIADTASRGRGITELGPLNAAFSAREGTLRDIDRAQELGIDRSIAEASGKAYETTKQTLTAQNENFPTELQQKLAEGQQASDLALDRFKRETPLAVSRAAGVAGASERARLAPDIVKAQIDKLAKEEAVRAMFKEPTDTQARAAGMAPILFESDKGIRSFEDKRIDLAGGTQILGGTPFGSKLINSDQKSLFQHARNFVNIGNLILTGVQGREEEYGRFLTTFVGVEGEDDRSRAQKRRARELFTDAVLARAKRGMGGTLDEVMAEVQAKLAGGGSPPPTPGFDRSAAESLLNQLRPQ